MPVTRTSTRPRRSLRLQSVPADSMLSSRPSRAPRTKAAPQRFQHPPTAPRTKAGPQRFQHPPTASRTKAGQKQGRTIGLIPKPARTPTPDERSVCRTPPPHPEPDTIWYLNHRGRMSPHLYSVEVGAPAGHDPSEVPVCAARKMGGLLKYLPRCPHLRHNYAERVDGTLAHVKKNYYVVFGCNHIYNSLKHARRHWECHDDPAAYITAVSSRAQALDIIDSEHDDISACGSVPDLSACGSIASDN
ncbi:hypothetical protein C8R47DRAFT_1074464 [Mycena vitilis]|nr:hypothetical protein C8R47DRAFT_1074464 [Mycena vitilis]